MSSPVVVRLAGEIDLHTKAAAGATVDEGVERAIAAGADLLVDLADVTFMGSAGLAVLVRAEKRLRPGGQAVRVTNVQSIVRRVFEVSGLLDMVADRA